MYKRQVLKEIDYFKNFYHLQPKVYLSYDRFAYFEKDDGDFRPGKVLMPQRTNHAPRGKVRITVQGSRLP